MENECIGCGCTDSKGCSHGDEPCHWLLLDQTLGLGVCSNCNEHIGAFKKHQKEMAEAFSE